MEKGKEELDFLDLFFFCEFKCYLLSKSRKLFAERELNFNIEPLLGLRNVKSFMIFY